MVAPKEGAQADCNRAREETIYSLPYIWSKPVLFCIIRSSSIAYIV
jgi:hypothetical protein